MSDKEAKSPTQAEPDTHPCCLETDGPISVKDDNEPCVPQPERCTTCDGAPSQDLESDADGDIHPLEKSQRDFVRRFGPGYGYGVFTDPVEPGR